MRREGFDNDAHSDRLREHIRRKHKEAEQLPAQRLILCGLPWLHQP